MNAIERTNPLTDDEFERQWLRRHKGSIVPKPRISSWGLIFGLILWGLIAVGAALVSGAHSVPAILQTIPAIVPSPFREILSLFGFTIFELLIFAGALYRRDNRYAAWGLWIAMIGALAANVGSSINAVTENGGEALNLLVAIILAITAPLAAFLAGELVHHLYEKHHSIIAAAFATYDEKRKELDATINREYTKYLKAFEADNRQTALPVSVVSVSEQTDRQADRQTAHSGYGHNRTSDGQQKVIEYLTINPDHAGYPSRKLAEMIGVGHDTANKGRNAWQVQRPTSNGNGHHETDNEGTNDQ